MSILPFIKQRGEAFDPAETRLMGEAFDAVQQALGTSGTPRICEDVAFRIIEAARSGERDPDRLVEAGLGWWRRNRSRV